MTWPGSLRRRFVRHRLADAAGEDLEAGLGDEGVDEAEHELAVVVAELGDGGQAVAEAVFRGAERSARAPSTSR